MNKRVTNKGRAIRSLLTPSNASLITNARQEKSPRKSPYKKVKNSKSKSYGGSLASEKNKKAPCSSTSDQETQAASTSALEGCNVPPGEAEESAPRLRSKRRRNKKDNTDLTARKTKELLKSDNERYCDTPVVTQKNEAGLPKIDKHTKDEDSKHEDLSNQNNFFNKRPNQPKSSIFKDCDLNLVACITDNTTKNNRSANFRNKPLERELNPHAESLFKLSRATKLTGTINKARRNIERQQEKTLRNITVRRKYPQSAIKSSNETIRVEEEKKICSPATLVSKPILRKKMPDFSAIHQQNFGKMESIVDHLERKARRAIVLTTSTVKKIKPHMKKESTVKKSTVEQVGHRAERTLELTPTTTRKVKLVMKPENSSKKVSKSSSFAGGQQIDSKSETPTKTKVVQLKCVQKLDTKFDKIQSNKQIEQENVNILPKADNKFDQIKTNKKVTRENVNILPKVEISKAKVEELNSRILEKRGLYKGKTEVGGGTRQKKNVEILRGVRSNRRFELQMKYRNSRD